MRERVPMWFFIVRGYHAGSVGRLFSNWGEQLELEIEHGAYITVKRHNTEFLEPVGKVGYV